MQCGGALPVPWGGLALALSFPLAGLRGTRHRSRGGRAQLSLPASRLGRGTCARSLPGSWRLALPVAVVALALLPAWRLRSGRSRTKLWGPEPAIRRSLSSPRLGSLRCPSVMRRPSVLPRGPPLGPCMASGLLCAPLPFWPGHPQRISLAQVQVAALSCRTGVEGFSGPPSPLPSVGLR